MKNEKLVRVNMTENYLKQMAAAEEIAFKTHKQLLADGWKWDGMDGYHWDMADGPPPPDANLEAIMGSLPYPSESGRKWENKR